MANFSTPFALTGPRRNPTADERANGFPCGGADQLLFNGMFHRIEAEIGNVLVAAGISQSDGSFSQLAQAINTLIVAATGGGDTSSYIQVSQATARLPFFPEIVSADGTINVVSPAPGTVRVPAGVTIMHRGISPYVTAETDLATVASRTYHLRWNPDDGFTLKWLGDGAYNPSTLDEGDVDFDTTFDDMLLARVVTNSSNVATITTLANQAFLRNNQVVVGSDIRLNAGNGANVLVEATLNWSRRPSNFSLDPISVGSNAPADLDVRFTNTGVDRNSQASVASGTVEIPLDRYGVSTVYMRDYMSGAIFNLNATA